MLNVFTVPPPVPHVSTSSRGLSAGNSIIARRSARTTAASSAGCSPRTRSPTSIAAICAGVASPAKIASNAALSSSGDGASPRVSRRTVASSGLVAGAAGLADTERFHESFGKSGVGRDERDDEPEKPDTVHVFLREHAVHRAIREVDDADQLIVIDE